MAPDTENLMKEVYGLKSENAELRTSLKILIKTVDKLTKAVEKHVEEAPTYRNKVAELERRMCETEEKEKAREEESAKTRKDAMWSVWKIIAGVITGVILMWLGMIIR